MSRGIWTVTVLMVVLRQYIVMDENIKLKKQTFKMFCFV